MRKLSDPEGEEPFDCERGAVVSEQFGLVPADTNGSDLIAQHFKLAPEGLVVEGLPSFETWLSALERVKYIGRSVQWWLGDLLNYGEQTYGEKYSQALESTDYQYGSLANIAYVAGRIEPARRHVELSFTHHQEVAALPPVDQDELLANATIQRWSTKELREAVRKKALCRAAIDYPQPATGELKVINTAILEDPEVSALAKSVHIFKMTRPDGWQWSAEEAACYFKESEGCIESALAELLELAYVKYEPNNNGALVLRWCDRRG